jgi:hypothetical protein
MPKKTVTVVIITALVTLVLANKLRALPGLNKIPSV